MTYIGSTQGVLVRRAVHWAYISVFLEYLEERIANLGLVRWAYEEYVGCTKGA